MKKLGCYTGNIYSDGDHPEECCVNIPDKDLNEEEAERLNRIRENAHKKCKGCWSCPESNKCDIETIDDAIRYFNHSNTGFAVMLKIIPIAHTAGFMEAKGHIAIDNDDNLSEFLLIEYAKWYQSTASTSLEEHMIKALTEKYGTKNQ